VSDLDTMARKATRELLERGAPDVPARYADLTRIRTRRTTAKLVGIVAAVGLAAGGWQLAGSRDRRPTPAPEPSKTIVNGSLEARFGQGTTWVAVLGRPLDHLPRDMARYSDLQFTPDGASVVYHDARGRLMTADLATGDEHELTCSGGSCAGALSPDGTTVASAIKHGIRLQHVGTDRTTVVRLDGLKSIGTPAWSPDGTTLAFSTTDGVYTVAPGGGPRQVHRATHPSDNWLPVSWSPDGTRLAFFDTAASSRDTRFTAMTVGRDGGSPVTLHAAGHCYCLGLSPPSLAWSPDGSLVAVATVQLREGTAVYTVRPDGSDWHLVQAGNYEALAWQPLTE